MYVCIALTCCMLSRWRYDDDDGNILVPSGSETVRRSVGVFFFVRWLQGHAHIGRQQHADLTTADFWSKNKQTNPNNNNCARSSRRQTNWGGEKARCHPIHRSLQSNAHGYIPPVRPPFRLHRFTEPILPGRSLSSNPGSGEFERTCLTRRLSIEFIARHSPIPPVRN